MHRCIGDLFGLADDCQPLRRLQRLERVNVARSTQMAALLPLNIGDQFRFRAGSWFGRRFEVGGKKRETLRIATLADSAVSTRNRGETSGNRVAQTRSADIAGGF